MKRGFKQSAFRLMLCLWFTLIGIRTYAAEAAVSASASVVTPVGVNHAIADFWGATFTSDATTGGLIIRIAGAGLSAGDADTTRYFAVVGDTGSAQITLADFIKLAASKGTLSGDITVGLTMSAASETGSVTLTVAYN